MKELISRIVSSIIIGASIIIAGYFIAQCYRYKVIGHSLVLDTWTKKIYSIDGTYFSKIGEESKIEEEK